MNYKSPIDLIVSEMNLRMDGEIFKAVQNIGVNVDRDELIKALQYDRDQYQKGYKDRDAEIVRCKDCKHFCKVENAMVANQYCSNLHRAVTNAWFCADGERKDT